MPSEDTKKLEFNQNQKSDKAPYTIYADLECKTEKTDERKSDLENSSVTNVSEHIPSSFSISTIFSFRCRAIYIFTILFTYTEVRIA